MLQALELGDHAFVDLPRREQRLLEHGRFFLQETAAQLEGRDDGGGLAGADPVQGQQFVRGEVEERAEASVRQGEQLARQVEGARFSLPDTQEHGEEFAVAEAGRTAHQHLFARTLVRAEFRDFHSGARIRIKIVKTTIKIVSLRYVASI